eukprot:comp17851_c0_seq1/m.18022 comp17851_c0_seq1/g.18022  ORF comp17851_c0_seq1/g.18022 comp17851_c0_seq1/m.18022 type:complete len:227 (-) comp17851_c0_seq1:275-955(-)
MQFAREPPEPTREHWVPDPATDTCMLAGCSTHFGLVQRKHHCRRCGKIFCARCISYRLRLDVKAQPHAHGKVCKVCRQCYVATVGQAPSPGIHSHAEIMRQTLSVADFGGMPGRSQSSLSLSAQGGATSPEPPANSKKARPLSEGAAAANGAASPAMTKSKSVNDLNGLEVTTAKLKLFENGIEEEDEDDAPEFKPIPRKARTDTITDLPAVQAVGTPNEWTWSTF